MSSLIQYLRNGGRSGQSSGGKTEVPVVGGAVIAGALEQTATSRVDVQGDDGLQVPAYFRALYLLSDTVSRLPFIYQKLDTKLGVFSDFEASPYHWLLKYEPQDNMNSVQWMRQLVWQMLHDGEAFVFKRTAGTSSDPVELVLCSRHSASYQAINHTFTICDAINGINGTFDETDGNVLHFFIRTFDGFTGAPMLEYAKQTLDISRTAQKETLSRYSNGGNVSGILSGGSSAGGGAGGGRYSSGQIADLASQLDSQFRSGRRIGAINGEVKFDQFSMSSTDLQFLETLKHFSVADVGRMFGIPGFFLGDNGGAAYKSITEAMGVLMSMSVEPILRTIEAEFNRKLVDRGQCCSRRFIFDRNAVYAIDPVTMADLQAKQTANGTHTANDHRRYWNQPRIEGGDTQFISANLRNINEASQTTTPTPQEP